MALQAVSLFLLTFTCLQFRAKLFGFLALPFALLFALTSGMNLSDTFYIFGGTDTGPGEVFPYFPYLFCTIGIIFSSIATMVDEKHRLDAATRSKARGLWPPEQ